MAGAILAAFLGGDPPKSKKWTTANKILAGTALTSLLLDHATTVDFARNNRGLEEANPILGKRPSVGQVNAYSLSVALSGALLANKLPPKWRNIFLGGVTALELGAMLNNRRNGFRFNFRF